MEVLGLSLCSIGEFISHAISSVRTLHNLPTGAHKDYRSLAVLLRESGRFGLQMAHEGVRVGVPTPECCFVFNIR